MSFSDPWGTLEIQDGRWIRKDFGPLSLVVMNCRSEWWVAGLHDVTPHGLGFEGDAEAAEAINSWERWDRDPKDFRLYFRPSFPDLSVVARPLGALSLSPKGKTSFFVGMPAWIEVFGECQGEMVRLTSVPTEVMSKTWHGSPLSGNLGYALKTHAGRVFEPSMWPEHEIVCSISIVNEGSHNLPFERLYMETGHLAVFEKDGRLWGNAARIRSGADGANINNITYSQRPAAPFDDAVEISPARDGALRKSTIQSAFSKVLVHFTPFD